MVCDFKENHSFVVQDKIQSFHWNNSIVTIHPFVAYYKVADKLEHLNSWYHSSTFVSQAFYQYLKTKFPDT